MHTDFLTTVKTHKDHLKFLDEALNRLETACLRLKKQKCHFLHNSVVYLGHHVNAGELYPCAEKVRDAPTSTNISELKSFLGHLNYCSNSLPNLSTVLTPLNKLLRHSTPWHWGQQEMDAFQASKKLLISTPVLVHFDHILGLSLAFDYGINAVLLHQMPDCNIAFASWSLFEAENKYPQMEKDALACVLGVQKFHTNLYGHILTLAPFTRT